MASRDERPIDPNEVVAIYSTNDPGEAEIIRNALQAEGFRCELDGVTQGGFAELLEIKLLVRAVDADRARSVIDRHGFRRKGAPQAHS